MTYNKIIILEEVLGNIQHCTTKEQIEHEIKTMLEEAHIQLHKETLEQMEYMLTEDVYTEEEKEEIREDILIMKREMGEL